MKRASLFFASTCLSLVMAVLAGSIGYARTPSTAELAARCGEWLIGNLSPAPDSRLTISVAPQNTQNDCSGLITLLNKTGTVLGGGYPLEVSIESHNTNTQLPRDLLLIPGLGMDLKSVPVDITSGADVTIYAGLTLGAYAVGLSYFLLKMGLAFAPTGCLVSLEQMGLVSLRLAPILMTTAELGLKGDLVGSRAEFSRVVSVFYEKAADYLRAAVIGCSFELVKAILGKPVVIAKIILAYVTFIPVAIYDFFKYQGMGVAMQAAYSPPALPTSTPVPTRTPSRIPSPTATPAFTATPAAVIPLRGVVTQRANCRYGPGAPYLYKYGLLPDTRMEIIGRDLDGNWLQVQGIGGNNPCWIKADLIQADGESMSLPDTYPHTNGLPISPFFEQITLLGISVDGEGVNAEWLPHEIREDLRQEDVNEFIVEVWTCVNGIPAFNAYGTNETSFAFQVDDGCGMTSHADVIGQDKEGFSYPAEINLP